jgi:DNA-binding winged helix-turn-helix (wHTH) protein
VQVSHAGRAHIASAKTQAQPSQRSCWPFSCLTLTKPSRPRMTASDDGLSYTVHFSRRHAQTEVVRSKSLFLFEDHALDPNRRELRRGGTMVPVEPQVFDLLLYLIENRERVVRKDDLITSVWNGRIVLESTLATRINAARRALGDNGRDQRLIRTAARKGIRFVCVVRESPCPLPADGTIAKTDGAPKPRPAGDCMEAHSRWTRDLIAPSPDSRRSPCCRSLPSATNRSNRS